nr:Arl13 [Gefionella okellyi]
MFHLLANAFSSCREQSITKITLVILGVDNAGKTTILTDIKHEDTEMVTPTWGFASETIEHGKYTLTFFDLGGGKSLRGIWPRYFSEVHGCIYVVDASDPERIEESKQTFMEAIAETHMQGKPLLIFANKQDVDGALSAADVADRLDLASIHSHSYHIAACTAKHKLDTPMDPRLTAGLKWIVDTIDKDYKTLSVRVAKEAAEQAAKDAIEKERRLQRSREAKEERLREEAEAAAAAADALSTTNTDTVHTLQPSTQQPAVISPVVADTTGPAKFSSFSDSTAAAALPVLAESPGPTPGHHHHHGGGYHAALPGLLPGSVPDDTSSPRRTPTASSPRMHPLIRTASRDVKTQLVLDDTDRI